jgi:formylglycine-generating enzyme required for sulfatase activity
MWKSLITIPEPEHLSDLKNPTPVTERRWPPPAVLWGAAALVLLLAIISLATVVLTIKTKEGRLVLEGVPEQAEVRIDGRKVTLPWPGGGGPLKVTVPAGKHAVLVRKHGFRAFGEDASVETGAETPLRVRLQPIPAVQPPPAPEKAPKEFINTIGMKLVLIPAGEFLMGSPDSDKDAQADEKPQHRVRITRPFYLGAYEVTQGQFQAVTGMNPSRFKGSDDLPMECVSWEDAMAFCSRLNELEKGQLQGEIYRLPTEAEWEYACRAGTSTRFGFGDDEGALGEYAWFAGNRDGKQHHPVGQKRPNAWGLYDMHGNVLEWCWDWYEWKYYVNLPGTDPSGASGSWGRVCRGGSWVWWSDYPRFCRVAYRNANTPGCRLDCLGFRVARVGSGP